MYGVDQPTDAKAETDSALYSSYTASKWWTYPRAEMQNTQPCSAQGDTVGHRPACFHKFGVTCVCVCADFSQETEKEKRQKLIGTDMTPRAEIPLYASTQCA